MSLIRGNQVTKLDFFSPEIQPFETINKWQELFIGVSVINKQKVDVKKIIKPNFQFPAFLPRSLACLNTLTLFSSLKTFLMQLKYGQTLKNPPISLYLLIICATHNLQSREKKEDPGLEFYASNSSFCIIDLELKAKIHIFEVRVSQIGHMYHQVWKASQV